MSSTEKDQNSKSRFHDLLVDVIFISWIAYCLCGHLMYPFLLYVIAAYTRFGFLVFLYILWMIYDRQTPYNGGRMRNSYRVFPRLNIGKYLREYFPADLIKTADLSPDRNYMFCTFPHGFLCYGGSVNFLGDLTKFEELFPGLELRNATLNSNFHIPIARELVLNAGLISVSEQSILNLFKTKSAGLVCNIVVGGAAEALVSMPEEYQLVLKHRKGFIRVALKAGVPIVPVFCFGENQLADQVRNKTIRKIQEKIYKLTSYAPCIVKGRKFGPFYSCFPERKPVNVVVGKPFELPKIENPTKEEVSRYHEKFKADLMELFEENKVRYDPLGEKAKLVYV